MLALFTFCFALAVASADIKSVFNLDHGSNGQYGYNKIVGGLSSKPHRFPHHVSLQAARNSVSRPQHFCGGFIVNENYVVTAAHCYYNFSPQFSYYVKAGKHKLSVQETTEQVREFKEVKIHELYSGEVGPNDIAIIRLSKPLQFNEYVQPISLPDAGKNHTGRVIISGWGAITPSNFLFPDGLRFTPLPLIDVDVCRSAVKNYTFEDPIIENNLCTGPMMGGISPCVGDSGSALIQRRADGRFEAVGIASWTLVPCGVKGGPAIYTKVSSFRDWINNIVKN